MKKLIVIFSPVLLFQSVGGCFPALAGPKLSPQTLSAFEGSTWTRSEGVQSLETQRLILKVKSTGRTQKEVDVYTRNPETKIGRMVIRRGNDMPAQIKVSEFSVRRQGFATEAKFRLMQYVFDDLGFKKVSAYIIPSNTASIALHKKLGFEQDPLDPNSWQISKGEFKRLEDRLANDADFARDFFSARGVGP